MDIGEYNWDAWSHEDLHAMINGRGGGLVGILEGFTGRGVAGGSEAAGAWGRFTTLLDDLQRRTADALTRAGVSWEGQAAESARAGISPLAQWAGDAGVAGTATRGGTDSLVEFYSSARNSMPEPVAAGSTANADFLGIPAGFTHLLGGQTDQDVQERAAREAKLEAVRVLDSYRERSATSVAELGRFLPPPIVVAEIGVVTPEVAPVGETPWSVSGITAAQSSSVTGQDRPPDADQPPSRPSTDEAPTTVASSRPAPSAVSSQVGVQDTTHTSTSNAPGVVAGSAARTGLAGTPGAETKPKVGTGSGIGGGTGIGSGTGLGGGTGVRSGARTGGGATGRPMPPGGHPVVAPRGGGGPGVLGEQVAVRQQNQAPQAANAKAQPGGAVPPANRPSEEEDLERFTPGYLNGSHDEFWGVEPSGRVAPPVIGG